MTRSNSSLASRLNRRVVIQQVALTADNAGGYTQSWNQFAEVWADVMPKRANENVEHEKLQARRNVVFVMRYLDGVIEGMRLNYDERIFNIVGILNPYEENVLLEITAEEVVA